MQATSITSILRLDPPPGIVFLFGEEDFLLEEAHGTILQALAKKSVSEFDIDMVDGEEISAEQIVGMASAFPMMGDRRLVAVKHFEKSVGGKRAKQAEKSPLGAYLAAPAPHSTIVITLTPGCTAIENLKGMSALSNSGKQADKAQAKLKKLAFPYKQLIEHAHWLEFPRLPESAIGSWISKRAQSRGKTISPEAAEFIVARCGPSLREISQELDKLMLFVGEKAELTLDDALTVVGESREYNVFELQKAVGEKATSKAMVILDRMMRADRQEMLIISMLTRYFLQLWKLLDASGARMSPFDAAKATGINSYFIPEYMSVLQRYTATQLDNAFFALRDADRRLKSGSDDPLMILQQSLLRVMS
ncbi:MAG: DNA polymerase III subunit delta [Candidatus Kapaibacterium sp.]|jgi:DNA polymerase-3 subunit delta